MEFEIELSNIQHVQRAKLTVDLSKNGITCIVGKNGVGKTTLMRALRNLAHADTFIKTAGRNIFRADSEIKYTFDGVSLVFAFDHRLSGLNCKAPIAPSLRKLCSVELTAPHGERFNFFQTVSNADADIRQRIVLGDYRRPGELIEFLEGVYSSQKFDRLVEIEVKGKLYYCLLQDDNRYLREDYLSSGEYFLISMYRTIRSAAKLIAVDELDLSLDAAAQVHLLRYLRIFCQKYSCNVVATTHSLAMMRMLDGPELLYMEPQHDGVTLTPASYSYVKARLFGFAGWDRYILTEDKILVGLIETIIRKGCGPLFFTYKVIYVAGGTQVVDLLLRNRTERFLGEDDQVIAILDGDQRNERHAHEDGVHMIPVESVEKALGKYYAEEDFPYRLKPGKGFGNEKDLKNSLIRDGVMSIDDLYEFIYMREEVRLQPLVNKLKAFLIFRQ